MMKYNTAILFLAIIITSGCGPSKEERAIIRLNEIEKIKNEGNYNLAKLKIDTLLNKYGDLEEQSSKASSILKSIKITEQQNSLQYLDSMYKVNDEILKPMMSNFIISDEYGSEKILIHRRQRPENSYNRTFLRAHLNMKGDFYISSRYHGEEWINHNHIRVYFGNESVISQIIPEEDKLNNRKFEDDHYKWEIVNYKDGADNGIIDFIASNHEKRLRVQFRGDGYEYIIMEKFDRKAIYEGYEISFILQEQSQIERERKKIKAEIERLKSQ
ncbi:hypothetical protein QA597_00685 [Marinilabiliaceae bacterium ANBcel2]|nr:hypothetical protein [Marinilabiliaceae bacterium ANBcel2]